MAAAKYRELQRLTVQYARVLDLANNDNDTPADTPADMESMDVEVES